ncbi:hypothetical protein NQ317_008092 [Molorchus minor]|uniref:Uncharacterized protein n=1 Tax=Molorchus minor TaxID=1323400 RepID=A0ABQ9JE17_9CUCU|nr:hypothetical protein NQ317_008092 [Molorchus minor]
MRMLCHSISSVQQDAIITGLLQKDFGLLPFIYKKAKLTHNSLLTSYGMTLRSGVIHKQPMVPSQDYTNQALWRLYKLVQGSN